MKKFIYLAVFAAVLGACTSSKEISVKNNVTIEIDSRPVIDSFTAWRKGDLDMYEGSSLGIYCFVYDEEGNLVGKAEDSFDDYTIASWTLEGVPSGEYHIVSMSFASTDEYEAYVIEEDQSLETLEIYQNFFDTFYSSWACLGLSYDKVEVGDGKTIKVDLEPACAYISLNFKNMISINDGIADGVAFWMKNNRYVDFQDGEPDFSNQLSMHNYYTTSASMPSDEYTGVYKALFLLPSESMSYQASYLLGEEHYEEFALGSMSVEAAEQYVVIVDCPEKTISVETKSDAGHAHGCQAKNPGSIKVNDYFGIIR